MMARFVLNRLGLMLATALCLTFAVFCLTNLHPNLEKLAKTQVNSRMSDAQVEAWLEHNGYEQPILRRYGEWLGIVPGWVGTDANDSPSGRCVGLGAAPSEAPRVCAGGQGYF